MEGRGRSSAGRVGRWAIGLAAAWLAGATAAGAQTREPSDPGSGMEGTWYAQALAHSSVGINVTHFWSKDDKLRAETVIAGRRVVTLVVGDVYYAYDLLVRTGLAIQRSELAVRQDAERVRPFGNEWTALVRQGAEKVRDEELGGRATELYQVTDGQGRRRIWVTQDELRLPLRVEIFRRATKQTITTDFLNWQQGLPIADEFFTVEPGIALAPLSYQQYVDKQAERVPLGPVPVLYTDLLHGY